MKLIVDQPKNKTVDGKGLAQQQDLLSETCAGLVKDALRKLQTLSPKFVFPERARDSRMLTRSFELLESGAPQVTAREEAAVAAPDKAAPMVPTAALVDADGRVTARVDAAACRNPSPSPTVETVPWQAWYSGVEEQRLDMFDITEHSSSAMLASDAADP